MKNSTNYTTCFILLFMFLVTILSACSKNTAYPCPGAGRSSASSFSLFDENGQPKSKGSSKKDNGLMNKKTPKQIRKR